MKAAPTEALDRICLVERTHAYMQIVYDKLCMELPSISKEDRLSLTFRALNDTTNSDIGISATTLVFRI